MNDPWSWPNGVIPNCLAALTTCLVLLITWLRKRDQIRRWLGPEVPVSLEWAFPLRGRWLRLGLKAVTLLLLATLLVFFVFTSALVAMMPVYALGVIFNPKQ